VIYCFNQDFLRLPVKVFESAAAVTGAYWQVSTEKRDYHVLYCTAKEMPECSITHESRSSLFLNISCIQLNTGVWHF